MEISNIRSELSPNHNIKVHQPEDYTLPKLNENANQIDNTMVYL